MASQPEIFENLQNLAGNLKTKLGDAATIKKVIAIYAFNATGKTRLSNLLSGNDENGELLETENGEILDTENSETIEEEGKIKTLCYNAFLEDVFIWDNDSCVLKFNLKSWFIQIIKGEGLDGKIIENFTDIVNQNGLKLEPYIDFKEGERDDNGNRILEGDVSFKIASGDNESVNNVKISKGEESIFIWSVFYTILEAAISELILKEENRTTDIFNDLEYIIIDDPVSSIDDTRIISLAIKLVELIRDDQIEKHLEKTKLELEKQEDFSPEYIQTRLEEIKSENYEELKLKFLLTTHHALYYNVLVNSFKLQARSNKFLSYSLSRENNNLKLVKQGDSPFSYHLAVKELILKVINNNGIEKYHFNLLRALLEKTANFLGYVNWYDCITGDNKQESTRLLNNYSHSRLSDLESNELSSRDKEIFIVTFNDFIEKFKYN